MANVLEVTDGNFQTEVVDSKIPVVVDFFATWCGPCKVLSPVIEEVSKDYAGKVKVVKMDVDKSNETAVKFSIMSVPTVVFFKGGKEIGRNIGSVPKGVLEEQLAKVM